MSDTPETDDEIRTPRFDFEYMGEPECVDASFARKLERERDEARSVAAVMRDKAAGREKGDPEVWEDDEIFPWDNAKSDSR